MNPSTKGAERGNRADCSKQFFGQFGGSKEVEWDKALQAVHWHLDERALSLQYIDFLTLLCMLLPLVLISCDSF